MDNIAKVKGLSFRTQYGIRANFNESKRYTPVWYVASNQNNTNSSLTMSRNNFTSWLWNGYLMYNRVIGKHSINSTLGAEFRIFVTQP